MVLLVRLHRHFLRHLRVLLIFSFDWILILVALWLCRYFWYVGVVDLLFYHNSKGSFCHYFYLLWRFMVWKDVKRDSTTTVTSLTLSDFMLKHSFIKIRQVSRSVFKGVYLFLGSQVNQGVFILKFWKWHGKGPFDLRTHLILVRVPTDKVPDPRHVQSSIGGQPWTIVLIGLS